MLFAGTWFIKYPDIIQVNASLTAFDAPKEIVVRQDGKLVQLFVANDDTVTKGQTIAWIESTADHKEIVALSAMLDKGIQYLSINETEKVSGFFKNGFQIMT